MKVVIGDTRGMGIKRMSRPAEIWKNQNLGFLLQCMGIEADGKAVLVLTCTVCREAFLSTRRVRYCGLPCARRVWNDRPVKALR
jgi:hypothetical protein